MIRTAAPTRAPDLRSVLTDAEELQLRCHLMELHRAADARPPWGSAVNGARHAVLQALTLGASWWSGAELHGAVAVLSALVRDSRALGAPEVVVAPVEAFVSELAERAAVVPAQRVADAAG